jgi:hypothetical protein
MPFKLGKGRTSMLRNRANQTSVDKAIEKKSAKRIAAVRKKGKGAPFFTPGLAKALDAVKKKKGVRSKRGSHDTIDVKAVWDGEKKPMTKKGVIKHLRDLEKTRERASAGISVLKAFSKFFK